MADVEQVLVKQLEGRQRELITHAAMVSKGLGEQKVKAEEVALQAEANVMALLEVAIGESPAGCSLDLESGIVTKPKRKAKPHRRAKGKPKAGKGKAK